MVEAWSKHVECFAWGEEADGASRAPIEFFNDRVQAEGVIHLGFLSWGPEQFELADDADDGGSLDGGASDEFAGRLAGSPLGRPASLARSRALSPSMLRIVSHSSLTSEASLAPETAANSK